MPKPHYVLCVLVCLLIGLSGCGLFHNDSKEMLERSRVYFAMPPEATVTPETLESHLRALFDEGDSVTVIRNWLKENGVGEDRDSHLFPDRDSNSLVVRVNAKSGRKRVNRPVLTVYFDLDANNKLKQVFVVETSMEIIKRDANPVGDP